jgi:hypothetical protein
MSLGHLPILIQRSDEVMPHASLADFPVPLRPLG